MDSIKSDHFDKWKPSPFKQFGPIIDLDSSRTVVGVLHKVVGIKGGGAMYVRGVGAGRVGRACGDGTFTHSALPTLQAMWIGRDPKELRI